MKHVWNFIVGSWKDLLIATLFIAFAASLNASMDTLEHHFNKSVFSEMGSYFESDWTRKYERDPETGELLDPLQRKKFWFIKVHPLFFDAWHLFKSAMIFLIIMFGSTFIFARERFVFSWSKTNHWLLLMSLIIYFSIVWNGTFNLFYDYWLLL